VGARRDDTDRLASRWSAELLSWAIPEDILAAAAESPWTHPVAVFARSASTDLEASPDTPSYRRALEALLADGSAPAAGRARSVLDVGAGAGAASLPLAPPATRVVAVDEDERMLRAFEALAASRGIETETVLGRWPECADRIGEADVVVCHHVLYNIADLVPFVTALDAHARLRVVVEMTETHPLSYLNDLWRVIHGVERPTGPTASDAAALIESLGIDVRVEAFTRPSRWAEEDRPTRVALARQRLCARPEHDEVIASMLSEEDRGLVALWWDRPEG